MLEGSTFIYLHNDHLGSPALTTSGTISSTLKFYAYGKPRSSSGTQPTRYQFTGQYQDDSGLTFMNARYYDPSIGTFISADTIVPSPGAAVAYNRYAYANLNPMNLVDPSGHDACGSGANPYCDEYQQGLIKSCHSNARECNITYEMFLAAMQQYVLYALNPDQYFIDVLIETGQIEGSSSDRAAASQRTAYAILYSQNFLNLEIEIAIERESNGLGPVTTALDKSPNSGLGAVASGVIGGGAYWKLKPSGALRAHHMPAKSVSGISEGKGPAILMEPEDHVLTSSYGYSQEAIAYRATIKQMIAEGRIRDAMAAEIRDVRRVAQENQGSPSYYNTEVMEMLDYAKQAGYLDKK